MKRKFGIFIMLIILLSVIAVYLGGLNNGSVSINKKGDMKKVTKVSSEPNSYELDIDRWNIYNDGSHPQETTKGFNDALQWANKNKIKIFKVPPGSYLIKKGDPYDPSSRINMVSNITFLLEKGAVIQKETNGKERYELLYVGPGINNVTIKGGTYRGDLDTHDYTGKDASYSGGTHEFGYGIYAQSAKNLIIDNVKVEKFTGDGIFIGGKSQQIKILSEEDFEPGAIDNKGKLIDDPSKIRTKNIEKTNFNHFIFNKIRTIQFSRPVNMSKKIRFDIYFYGPDGVFISGLKDQEIDWSLVEVPQNANYFHVVFDTPTYSGVKLEYWNKGISEGIKIKNSESSFNRRQGITVAGVKNMQIINNIIHDIKGTAPQSGIDIEAGFFPNSDIVIKKNKIFNNASYNVILYDGQNVVVQENYLGPNENRSSIGLAVSKPFRSGAVIINNKFDGSKIAVADHVVFEGNHMKDSVASIGGPNVSINGTEFVDSQLRIGSQEPFGIEISNITMKNNKKSTSGLVINKQPVNMSNITIMGESTLRNITGDVADGSIIDNLKVTEYNSEYGIDLPPGNYKNCVFEAASGGSGVIVLNNPGKYTFKNCSFKTNEKGLIVDGKKIDFTFENSTLDLRGGGEGIVVKAAASINIKNNIIRSKNASIGISTVDLGTAANIQDNILINAKLNLKVGDINKNNHESSK